MHNHKLQLLGLSLPLLPHVSMGSFRRASISQHWEAHVQKCVNPQSKWQQGGHVCVARWQTPVLLYSWGSSPRCVWLSVMSVLWLYTFSSPLFSCKQALGLFFPSLGCLSFLLLFSGSDFLVDFVTFIILFFMLSILFLMRDGGGGRKKSRGLEAMMNFGSVWKDAQLFPS